MLHVITAGPRGAMGTASWSSKTGELDGDPVILDKARKLETITTDIHKGEQPIDWHDIKTAVPALMDAAQSAWGGPVHHDTIPEEGDPKAVSSVSLPQPA